MSSSRLPEGPVSGPRLLEILDHLRDGRQHIRGENGIEVPFYALPMTREEALTLTAELLARRRATEFQHHGPGPLSRLGDVGEAFNRVRTELGGL